ncbi:MAG: hypothetical protein AAF607_13385 [Pseudomonadota bacterium]
MMLSFIKRIVTCGVVAAVAALAIPAHSAIIATLTEGPQGVTLDIEGSFDISGLSGGGIFNFNVAAIKPDNFFGVRPGQSYRFYTPNLTGPATFGPGTLEAQTTNQSGDVFFYNNLNDRIAFATDYVSGSQLSSTAFFPFFTFSDLGVTPGTYVWSNPTNSVTLNVGSPAVIPVPASGVMVGSLLLGCIALRRFKRG